MNPFDLLTTVEYGGCSAKLPAEALGKALAGLPSTPHENLLVGIDTHDDAGVYRISDDLALVQTTDFFSPVCSDPYDFGQIAAANALSDVYAMGGEVMTVLNIVAFPAAVPLEVLREILRGGIEKVKEAGGVILGGHTIVNDTPLYGLAVTGTVHPNRIITNSAAKAGDVLILTKPIGAGIIMAGKRIGEIGEATYLAVLNSMKQLNSRGAVVMRKFGVSCATDVTGFGLAGHALKMALGSGVTIRLFAGQVQKPGNVGGWRGLAAFAQAHRDRAVRTRLAPFVCPGAQFVGVGKLLHQPQPRLIGAGCPRAIGRRGRDPGDHVDIGLYLLRIGVDQSLEDPVHKLCHESGKGDSLQRVAGHTGKLTVCRRIKRHVG